MIGDAWYKSAIPAIGVSGFKATGIYPYDPNAIPEYFFRISDTSVGSAQNDNLESVNVNPKSIQNTNELSLPGTSISYMEHIQDIQMYTSPASIVPQEETPTKTLQTVSPFPIIRQKVSKRKQNVKVLTSENHLTTRKLFEDKKKSQKKKLITVASKRKKNFKNLSSSSESEEELQLSESSEDCIDENENTCVERLESYYHTKKKSDWIQCTQCSGWLHEDCTSHAEKCNKCSAKNKGKGKREKVVKMRGFAGAFKTDVSV